MVGNIFYNKYLWRTIDIIVGVFIFFVVINYSIEFKAFLKIIYMIIGITGVSLIVIFKFLKKKNINIKEVIFLTVVIFVSATGALIYVGHDIKLVVDDKVVVQNSEEVNPVSSDKEIKTEEDFYPVITPDKLSIEIDGGNAINNCDSTLATSGLYSVIDDTLRELIPENVNGESKSELRTQIENIIKNKISTGSQPTNEEVNGNREFTKKVGNANELSDTLDEKVMDVQLLRQIINLREEAYNVYQTTSLRKLLANNYTKLGKYYYQMNKNQSANESLLKAIKYECAYLQMMKRDDNEYYIHLYRIGMIYQLIGDIENINNEYKHHALLISACFLELSALNILPEDDERFAFYSSYYAGMVNHKLAISAGVKKDCTSYIYIVDSLDNYIQSINVENYKKQRRQQFTYVAQVALLGEEYRNSFGSKPNLPSWGELERIYDKYSVGSKKL